jgi:hypothetical protein
MKRTPLLDYLDQLEAVAKAATRIGDLVGIPRAEALALISKLREAIGIVRRATEIASMQASDWRGVSEPPAEVPNHFQDQVAEWARIEVPAGPAGTAQRVMGDRELGLGIGLGIGPGLGEMLRVRGIDPRSIVDPKPGSRQ